MAAPLFQAYAARFSREKPGIQFERVPTGSRIDHKEKISRPALPRIECTVRVPICIFLVYPDQIPFVYFYFKIGTVPNYSRYQSMQASFDKMFMEAFC
jgi:hypothetical protein